MLSIDYYLLAMCKDELALTNATALTNGPNPDTWVLEVAAG